MADLNDWRERLPDDRIEMLVREIMKLRADIAALQELYRQLASRIDHAP